MRRAAALGTSQVRVRAEESRDEERKGEVRWDTCALLPLRVLGLPSKSYFWQNVEWCDLWQRGEVTLARVPMASSP